MLKVTIELVHATDPSKNGVIGTAKIVNDGSGSHVLGNYRAKIVEGPMHKCGSVEGFRRLEKGPWDLLYLALRNIVGRRNP